MLTPVFTTRRIRSRLHVIFSLMMVYMSTSTNKSLNICLITLIVSSKLFKEICDVMLGFRSSKFMMLV
jgi:hypothetical protein